jgi:adenylate cyclase
LSVTRSTIQRLRLLILMVATGAAVGSLYAVIQAPPDFDWLVEVATGGTIGSIISSCVLGVELFGASWLFERGGRRVPLLGAMLTRMVMYTAVIMSALMLIPWLYSGDEPNPFRARIATDIVFSFAVIFVIVSLTSIAQVIGPNVLGNLLTGRYHRPREEQRIVLVLDLVDSTGIAERIGNVQFHALLSDTFTLLARIVTDFGGEIHRYVGDALIATWPLATPEENARPILSLFACRDMLDKAASDLLSRHGTMTSFRAGIHAGPVVAGEVGGFKREIVLVGDAMNTAARLEQACRTTGHALLASQQALGCAAIPADITAISIGHHQLRGKAESLELFSIERRTADRMVDRDRHRSTMPSRRSDECKPYPLLLSSRCSASSSV